MVQLLLFRVVVYDPPTQKSILVKIKDETDWEFQITLRGIQAMTSSDHVEPKSIYLPEIKDAMLNIKHPKSHR